MKYEHDIIKDLMPLCIDGIASEKSSEAVMEHISECPECAAEWESMQKQITVTDSNEITPDAKQYVKAAKKFRLHNLLNLVKIAVSAAVILLILGTALSYLDGDRFTMKGIVKDFAKTNIKDDYIYLGDVDNNSNTLSQAFIIANWPGTNEPQFYTVYAVRQDALHLLRSFCGHSSSPLNEMPVYTLTGYSETRNEASYELYCIGFLASDKAVKTIEYTAGGCTRTVELDENGYFCESCKRGMNIVTEGKAMDKDGKVLYTLQQRTEKPNGKKLSHGIDTEYTYTEWVKPE